MSLIIFFLRYFLFLFAKNKDVYTKESDDHADDLEQCRPLGVNESGDYHLPSTLLIVYGLDRSSLAIFQCETHENESSGYKGARYESYQDVHCIVPCCFSR